MERRVLLAIVLSFLVLFLYQTFLVPPVPPERRAAAPSPPPASAAKDPSASTAVAPPAVPSIAEPKPPDAPVVLGEDRERDITVETRTVRAVFSNRGGRLRHWVLKDYRNDSGGELDLVPDPGKVQNAYTPFSLRLDDADLTSRVNGGLYRSDAPDRIDATASEVTLTFEWGDASALKVRKSFTLGPAGYLVTAAIDVQQDEKALAPVIEWGPGLGDDIARAPTGSFLAPSYSTPAQALVHRDGAVERQSQAVPGVLDGPFLFAGIDDHYFAALVVNDRSRPVPLRFDFTPYIVPPEGAGQAPGRYAAFGVRRTDGSGPMKFFVGPKAFDELRTVDTELVRAINFGVFAWLAVPLLGALKWVYQYIGNWGWSIIWLTVLINVAMFPLRHKAVTSMRKMQEIQPQMKAIQERYAKFKITDPQRQKMNQEVMELYKSKGVNPASGCVPMLLTFPFLFAFYAMLSQAIEIRGADFLGWIDDLSRPDPWYITPLLMGATMFWQQKITPTSMDPVQQRVMMIMPIMFTFMFLAYPSGLVVYWTMSNVWAIGQQYFTNWMLPLPAARAKS
jgi:YidC/Oxa1 family membrane protein insertase